MYITGFTNEAQCEGSLCGWRVRGLRTRRACGAAARGGVGVGVAWVARHSAGARMAPIRVYVGVDGGGTKVRGAPRVCCRVRKALEAGVRAVRARGRERALRALLRATRVPERGGLTAHLTLRPAPRRPLDCRRRPRFTWPAALPLGSARQLKSKRSRRGRRAGGARGRSAGCHRISQG